MRNILNIGDIIDTGYVVNSPVIGKRRLLYYSKRVPKGNAKEFVANRIILHDIDNASVIVSMRDSIVPFMVSTGKGSWIKKGEW